MIKYDGSMTFTALDEVENYLNSLSTPGKDHARLEHVKAVLEILQNPQDSIRAIHIAGTSGKGSTAYYTSRMLQIAGYSVGMMVSPHVNKVSERAQINGEPLADEEYCCYISEFVELVRRHEFVLTYIEFLNTFAYWLFAKLKVDYMVIEVGLGGRLDPTNVMQREDKVCVITDIGFDHVEILGDTLGKITKEKAGIIQSQNQVVMLRQSDEIMQVISDAVAEKNASLQIVSLKPTKSNDLPVFQQRNWTLAKAAVKQRLQIDQRSISDQNDLERSKNIVIPGRFEHFEYNSMSVVVDAAHNPQKIEALTGAVERQYPSKRVVYLVAFGQNKRSSVSRCMQLLTSTAASLVATQFSAKVDTKRGAISPDDIVVAAAKHGIKAIAVSDAFQALDEALRRAKDINAIVVVTGSFYLIDGIRLRLLAKQERSSPQKKILLVYN